MDTNDDRVGSTFQAALVSEMAVLEAVRYDKASGLVPVIVQDATTGSVLTLAYANREALKRTFGTGQAWFWSRSRQEYWQKGETSGNTQRVIDIRLDCDGDAVLYLVEPAGPACHTGAYTCFFRGVTHHGDKPGRPDQVAHGGETAAFGTAVMVDAAGHTAAVRSFDRVVDDAEPPANDPSTRASGNDALTHLWQVMQTRWESRPQGSYTTYLFEHGVDKVAKKVGEECAEVVIAAKNATWSEGVTVESGRAELAQESADLLFHLFALWKVSGITPEAVYQVLQDRAGK